MSSPSAYAPPADFVRRAHVQGMEAYRALYDAARANPEGFWGDLAAREIHWFSSWDKVLDWSNAPFAKWFTGAKTNVSYNCLDRHLTRRAARQACDYLGRRARRFRGA